MEGGPWKGCRGTWTGGQCFQLSHYERCPDVIDKLTEKHATNTGTWANMKIEVSKCKTNFGRPSFRHNLECTS